MKKINSKIGTWILSSIGAAAIALSIAISLPTISKANEPPMGCSVDCAGGGSVSCPADHGCWASANYCGFYDAQGARRERYC